MKQAITRVASSIIDLAGEIGTEAEALADDSGIVGMECILYLLGAQRALDQARDVLRFEIAHTMESAER
jgi:hypothetical protein